LTISGDDGDDRPNVNAWKYIYIPSAFFVAKENGLAPEIVFFSDLKKNQQIGPPHQGKNDPFLPDLPITSGRNL